MRSCQGGQLLITTFSAFGTVLPARLGSQVTHRAGGFIIRGAMPTSEDFTTNMLRMICATLYSSVSLQIARDMYGKGYFALGVGEKLTVDQAAFALIAGNFQSV